MYNNTLRIAALAATVFTVGLSTESQAQTDQYWYNAPFGKSQNWFKNNFGVWVSTPVSDYSMPGAATNGNSFFVVKGALSNDGNVARSSRLYQRTGNASTGTWKDWGNRYPQPELFSLRVPILSGGFVNVRSKTNLPKNWWYDTTTAAVNSFAITGEWGYNGPYSRIPGTNKFVAPIKHYPGWVYMGDYAVRDFGVAGFPTTVASNTPLKPTIDMIDFCAAGPNLAFAIDSQNQLWRITNGLGIWNVTSNVYTNLGTGLFGFRTLADKPGFAGVNATDSNGDLYEINQAGQMWNLGKPTTLGVFSTPAVFDGGKHYIIATGTQANGTQRLYFKAFDWGLNTWLPWTALPNLLPYSPGVGKTVARHIVGSPTLDESAKKVLVVDQEGGYWRGGWNWNETTWVWEYHGKP